jgi:hypothetical protein
MNISLFGYTIQLDILIFIGVIYLIIVSNTVCSCCSVNGMGLIEGLATMSMDASGNTTKENANIKAKEKMLRTQTTSDGGAAKIAEGELLKVNKEGFVGANINYGKSAPYQLGVNDAVNTSSWMGDNLTVTKGAPLNPAVSNFIHRENGPIPLPEGELDFFQNIPFSPSCCQNGGSSYSSSMGCACFNSKSYNYLVQRGGNNVPYQDI